jgi:hypothetical protein
VEVLVQVFLDQVIRIDRYSGSSGIRIDRCFWIRGSSGLTGSSGSAGSSGVDGGNAGKIFYLAKGIKFRWIYKSYINTTCD